MRAVKLQNDLAALVEIAPEDMPRIEAMLTRGMLEEMQSAPPLAWLPAGHGLELVEVAHVVLKSSAERAWYRRAVERSLESPLLGSFAETAASVFGRRPLSFLKWMARSWDAVYRGCGRLSLESAEHLAPEVRARLIQEPAPMLFSGLFPRSVAIGLEAASSACGFHVSGSVERTGARIEYQFAWQEALALPAFGWVDRAPPRRS